MAEIDEQQDPNSTKDKFNFYELRQMFQNVGVKVLKRAWQSINFVTGVTGWYIGAEGDVEFGDGVFRGSFNLGGTNVTIGTDDDIQDTIDSVNANGGGIVYLQAGTYYLEENIFLYSNISLIGAGKDSTILDFQDNVAGLKLSGTLIDIQKNVRMESFTVQNSDDTGGIEVANADFWSITNVKCSSNNGAGLLVFQVRDWICSLCDFSGNASAGCIIYGVADRSVERFTFINCTSSDGGGGFEINSFDGASHVSDFTFLNCTANDNTGYGFSFLGTPSPENVNGRYLGCTTDGNGINDFYFETGYLMSLTGCYFSGSMVFDVESSINIVTSCSGGYIEDYGTNGNTFVGNILTAGSSNVYNDKTIIVGTLGASAPMNRYIAFMKNTSGGTLAEGSVVTLKSVAAGDEITTTTSAGDDKVYGVLIQQLTNNSYGKVLITGKTTVLKVNGVTDIAVGDFLTTYTAAGIAAKASSGQTAFAVALEAYTTNDSNGVIDALIISPRKIS